VLQSKTQIHIYIMKNNMFNPTLLKKPSGFLPIAMSLAALAIVLVPIIIYGVARVEAGRGEDEGADAHLWQFLMGGQLPIVAFFLIKWLPQAIRPALLVLALQIIAALAAIAPVYLLHL
jgi:hypothetical protein